MFHNVYINILVNILRLVYIYIYVQYACSKVSYCLKCVVKVFGGQRFALGNS